MGEEQEMDYRQELGLKKILYKYQNENQQLRAQIKALNQRLQHILTKQSQTPQHIKKQQQQLTNPIQQYQGKLLKQQLQRLYKQVNQQSAQMKINKDSIDLRHQEKCKELENRIVKEERELRELRYKLGRYEVLDEGLRVGENNFNIPNQDNNVIINIMGISHITNNKTLRSSSVRLQNYLSKLSAINQQTQATKKSIKQLYHQRDTNQRQLIKKHLLQNDVKIQNRLLEFNVNSNGKTVDNNNKSPEQLPTITTKKRGIWSMQNTKQNYQFVKSQIEKLKQQKSATLEMIKNENIVLNNKLKQLQSELDGLNSCIDIPPIPYQKRPMKVPVDLSISRKLESPLLMMRKSLRPVDMVGGVAEESEYQRKNDKNFVVKMARKVEWESTKNSSSGIQWNDNQCKSPITGMNLWFEGHLLGIQILHEQGTSGQQMQILGGKRLNPIQYRLSSNDHLQNIILYISQGFIQGIELYSKNDRTNKFGNASSKARKFDFNIKKPQKPIVSFGQYKITNNVSEITKLGFEII